MPKDAGTGFTERSKSGGHDGGTGGGRVDKAGTGYLERSKSGPSDRGGSRSVPTGTGHATGIKKGADSGSDSVAGIPDGVGGPLPSA